MFLLIYNIIQLLLLLLLSPILGVVVFCTPKYRGRMSRRLGFDLGRCCVSSRRKVVWVHGLSVGELSSARMLLREIKTKYPDYFLVLSTTTRGGETFSESLRDCVDLIIPFPFDLLFVVRKFIATIHPDLFILIETDYWPNFLCELRRQGVPSILANGRITAKSMRAYHRGRPFFTMLFRIFDLVGMQTEKDAMSIVDLGVAPDRVIALGNLKYDTLTGTGDVCHISFGLPSGSPVVVAGSTHPGEEEIILQVFMKLLLKCADLVFVVAPRDVARAKIIAQMALDNGISVSLRSEKNKAVLPGSLLVLDTLGELAMLYRESSIVFVGGSLLEFGGHNPLEAAMLSKPVIFGPHMEDFQEIAADLLAAKGATVVGSEDELLTAMTTLIENSVLAEKMGANGARLVHLKSGAALRYAEIVGKIMGGKH